MSNAVLIDHSHMSEMAGHHAAFRFSREFHRDGVHRTHLQQMGSSTGPPTSVTTPGDGHTKFDNIGPKSSSL